ncbi:MAG: phosphatase PAP2 family protein [Candidatus Binatia bacterium]
MGLRNLHRQPRIFYANRNTTTAGTTVNLLEENPVSAPQQTLFHTWSKTEYVIFVLVGLYAFCAWLITQLYDRPEAFHGLLYAPVSGKILLLCFLPYVLLRILWIMVWRHPVHLTRTILQDFHHTFLHPQRLMHGVPLFFLFMVFFGAFTGMKDMIPVLNPYSWDQTFATLDAMLHGGIHPWRLLHKVVAYPPVTSAINISYNLWLVVLIVVFFWQALTLHLPRIRLQFLLSFFLSWIIIGHVLATFFSSAGPCYYAAVTGTQETPYDALMTYLQETNEIYPVWALKTQEMLWQSYTEKKLIMGSGISAMPSMHVTIAFLMVLVAWHWGGTYAFFLTSYFIIILVGSVHLAWHYAVDAYVAIPLTYGIWRLSGFVVRCLDPSPVQQKT